MCLVKTQPDATNMGIPITVGAFAGYYCITDRSVYGLLYYVL